MEPFALKQDMLLGTASPATQCEGGEEESSWIYWWGLGNVRDNASPAVAAQHRARWDADAEATLAALRERLLEVTASEVRSGGYVVDTFYAAKWCAATTDTYADCVVRAVNLGGDTDTTAAVAGALAGVLYGYEAIPADWLATLRRKDLIDAYPAWWPRTRTRKSCSAALRFTGSSLPTARLPRLTMCSCD